LSMMARKRGPDGDVLAIGVLNGHGSVEALLDGMEYWDLWCVDPWEGIENGDTDMNAIYPEWRSFLEAQSYQGVREFRMTSDRFFEELPADKKFKFIFVDGDHSFEQAFRDFTNSYRHLLPGGMVAGHDFGLESVQRAGKEARLFDTAVDSIRYRRFP